MKVNIAWPTTFRLIYILLVLSSLKTSYSKTQALFKVAVLYDLEIPIDQDKIWRLNKGNATRLFIENYSKAVTIKLVVYAIKELTPSQINVFFCEKIIQEDISAIALHTRDLNLTRYLAYLAAQFWIPCIGSTVDDQVLSQKDVYRSFLRTIPSETQQFRVFLDILLYTGNSEAYVIVSDETTYGHALEYFTKDDYTSITVVKVNRQGLSPNSVSDTLMRIKTSLASVVFLYCDVQVAEVLLWTAKDFRMFSNEFFWILSENIVLNTEHLFMLPSRIYAIMAEGHTSVDRFYMGRLTDTFTLLNAAVESLSERQLQSYIRKPGTCAEMREWKHGEKLYRKLVSTSVSTGPKSKIQLNQYGERVNFTHDILYLLEAEDYEKQWSTSGKWIEGKLSLQSTTTEETTQTSRVGLPTLRAAVVEYPPLTMKSNYDPAIGCTQGIKCINYIGNTENYTRHCCYGLAIDILTYVKSELQFEPLVYFVRDGNYGAKNVTSNQWNGIVRDLIIGEADISIDLMTNEARSEVVEFSQRWTEAGLALLVRVGEKKVSTVDFAFLDPFTMELWLGMVGIVNIYLIALWIADRLSPYGCYATRKRNEEEQVFDLDGSMWYSWGVCFDNQFVGDRPKSGGSKAMAVCLAMFALLCLTSYTANLTAHLVSDDTKPEISGIRDSKITSEDSKLTFGVVKSSFVDSYFELNKDPVMKSLFERMLTRNHLVKNFTDGVNRVNSSKLDIFISEILSLDYEVAKQRHKGYPRLQVVGASKTFADTGYSYSFRKNSTWKPKFDLVINKMKAENKPSELYKKWVRSGEASAEDIHDQLDYQSLSGVFIVGVALAILSFIFLLFENKLFSMGFIYRHLSKFENGERYERGRRRFSVEVHRKLLELKKPELPAKRGSVELPDISNYLEKSRKTRASIHALYNPARTKSVNDDRPNSVTPTNGSAKADFV